MGLLTEFKQSLVDTLQARVSDTDFVPDESNRSLYPALTRPLVCISLEKLSLAEAGLGNYVGDSFGRKATVDVKISVFSREVSGAGACMETFDRICEALLFDEGNSLREVSCGTAVYVGKHEVFRLDASLRYALLLVKEGSDEKVSGFRLFARPTGSLS